MPYLPLSVLSALGYNTAGVGDPDINQLRGALRMDMTNKGQAQAQQMAQAQALADAMRRRQGQAQENPAASPIPVDQTTLSRMPLNPQGMTPLDQRGMTPLDQRPRYSSYPPVVIGGSR